MPIWLQWTLIVTGLVVIALLTAFIVKQARVIKQTKVREARHRSFRAERRDSMIDSIRVLAMAIEQDQVEYSEGCLRIKGLLDHVEPELLEQSPFQVFQEIHNHLEHMPTHQARQETDLRFVQKMDRERYALEAKHSDRIRRAATALRHHPFRNAA
ncbi:MAG: DUF2489 domain-containing protein [Oleiphilaceae bacterium]|nr:DUF2489 domain-containing protein [Oleiphilaceae bacterium]